MKRSYLGLPAREAAGVKLKSPKNIPVLALFVIVMQTFVVYIDCQSQLFPACILAFFARLL